MTSLVLGAESPAQEVELPQAIRERVEAATVFIEVSYRPADVEIPRTRDLLWSSGSGFVIAREGLVVTNAHVVDAVTEYDAKTRSEATDRTSPNDRLVFVLHSVQVCVLSGTGNRRVYDAQVLCTRGMPMDLALLRITPTVPLVSLRLLDRDGFDRLRATRPVWAAGFPLGRNVQKILSGEPRLPLNPNGPSIDVHPAAISSFEYDGEEEVTAIRHTSLLERGNSGGPLVDSEGRIVGVNYYGINRLSFAIPVTVLAREFATVLKNRRDVDEGGVREKPLTVRVEPVDGDATESIRAALSKIAGSPGGTLEFAPGTFKTRALDFSGKGLLVRGGGRGRTKLVIPSNYGQIRVGEAEVCDLHVDGNLSVSEKSNGATSFLHDVDVWNDDIARTVSMAAGRSEPLLVRNRVDIVNCRIGSLALDAAAAPRVERTRVHLQCNQGGKPDDHCRVAVLGGEVRFWPAYKFVLGKDSDLTFRGTRIYNDAEGRELFRQTRVEVGNSRVVLKSCRFGRLPENREREVEGEGGMLQFNVSSGGRLQAVGCRFYHTTRIEVAGHDAIAELQGNSVVTGGMTFESYYSVANGGTAVFRGNHFRQFPRPNDLRDFAYPGEAIIAGSRWDDAQPLDGTWLKAVGRGTEVEFANNRFDTAQARSPFVLSGGATAKDGGENDYAGKSLRVAVKP